MPAPRFYYGQQDYIQQLNFLDAVATAQQGPQGLPGPAASLTIGSVTSGASAAATVTGVAPNQTLNLVLPQGPTGPASTVPGPTGPVGPTGPTGPATTLAIGSVATGPAAATLTGAAPNQTLNLTLPQGATGATGPANTLAIGTVTTGAAAATVTGAAPNQTLNLTLPTAAPNTLAIGTVASGAAPAATITGAAPNQTLNLTLPKGAVWRGAWVSGTTYAVDDWATDAGSTWRRKTAGAGTTAPGADATNWELAAGRGADGAGAVSSVNNVAPVGGNVTLTAANLGLGNVENKSSAVIRNELTGADVSLAIRTDGYSLSYAFEKTFTVTFPATAGKAVNLEFGNPIFAGVIELELTSSWSEANAMGAIVKRFQLGLNQNNSIWNNVSQVKEAVGLLPGHFAIGEFAWNAANSRYVIPISHLTATSNPIYLRVRGVVSDPATVKGLLAMSAVFDLAALPVNVAAFTGTASSATKLATPRAINGVNFDGTAPITITDDTKLPLTGGTLSGNIVLNSTGTERRLEFTTAGGTDAGLFGRNTDGAVGLYDWANTRAVWQYTPSTNLFAVYAPAFVYGGMTFNSALTMGAGATITTRNPSPAALVTGLTGGPISVPDTLAPKDAASFLPIVHQQTSTTTYGYRQHLSIGSWRSGNAAWDGAAYIAIGGDDLNPTEAFFFKYGGEITHSGGKVFLNSVNVGTYAGTKNNPVFTGTVTAGGRVGLPVILKDNGTSDFGNDVYLPYDGGGSTQKAFRLRSSYDNGSGRFTIGRSTNSAAQSTDPALLTYQEAFAITGDGSVLVGGSPAAKTTNETLIKPTIKGYIEQFQTLNPGATVTLNPDLGTLIELTTTANTTITLPAAVAGTCYTLIVKYGAAHTLTFAGGTAIKWANGNVIPTATSVAGKMDKFVFTCGTAYTLAQDGGRNF